MRSMLFTSRDTARATDILMKMVAEKDCTNILTIAGSTSAAGCMQVYVDMVRNKMVDVVVSTGASIIDMDLFEALGFKHYIGTKENVIPDTKLRELAGLSLQGVLIAENLLGVPEAERGVCDIKTACNHTSNGQRDVRTQHEGRTVAIEKRDGRARQFPAGLEHIAQFERWGLDGHVAPEFEALLDMARYRSSP